MIQLPLIHFDCKYFEGDRPCFANKQYGVFCNNCSYYEKIEGTDVEFRKIPEGRKISGSKEHKNILIIKLDAAGDVLRTTSVLPSIKKLLPASIVTWITKTKSMTVLRDNNYIDSVIPSESISDKVFSRKFEIAINLDSGKESCSIMKKISAEQYYGYTLAGGKPYPLNSFAGEWYLMGVDDNFKKQNKKSYHKIIHEICGLEYKNTVPVLELTESRIVNAAYIREKSGLANYSEFVLINLGGGNRWQYKKWTKEGYSGLINGLSLKKPGSAIGLIAGKDDESFYNDVLSSLRKQDNVIPFGCGNSINDFISIIYLADKIFTSDSLAFHIATALKKYTVVIVGPTSHTELDVFGSGKIVYSAKVDCLTCYLNKCDKIVTCMNTVSHEEIINYFF